MPRWSETDLRLYEQTRNMKSPTFIQESNAKAEAKAEKELHRQIDQFLRLKGVRAIVHARMDRKNTLPRGVPDFIFCISGHPMAVECKVGDNKLTPEQMRWIEDMHADGWETALVSSLEQFISLFNRFSAK